VPPRLAREAVTAAALRGDSVALLSASAYLPPREAFRYDRRRAAAFSSALAGERQLALSELGLGGGVRSVRLGLDTAVVELLTRGAAPAVEAVRLALRDGVHSEPDVPLVLAACVRRDPALTRSALAVATSGGTTLERTRAAAAVLGAARPGPIQAAVPAVVAVSLAVAVLAFLRLPGLIDTQEAATPRLREPRPAVVVAKPPDEAGDGGSGGAVTPQSSTSDGAAQIAVRFTPGEAGFGSADGTGSLNGRAGSRPSTPRPPTVPASPVPTAPGPTAPAPQAPSGPAASPPPPTIQFSPASGPATSAPPAAAPPAEDPRQPAGVKKSKAERKAEKAERKAEKAEQKAAKKADKTAAAPPPALSAQPAAASAPAPEAEAAVALESASAADDASTRHRKPDKPEKPEKPDKDE
jgi:hypothetical protein